jgi:hypothetical protein
MSDPVQRPRASIPRLPNAAAGDRRAGSPGCGFKAALRLDYSPALRGMSSREHDPNRGPTPLIGSTRSAFSLRIPKNDPASQAA